MAIKKDLSDLKVSTSARGGHLPDSDPRYAPLLAQAWATDIDLDDKPHAVEGSMFRHSWAGMCARRLGYAIHHVPVSNELSVADHWRFGLGTIVHERWQEKIQLVWPDAEVECKVTIPEIDSSGHIDAVIRTEVPGVGVFPGDTSSITKVTSLELKTIGGFGFKKSIGARGQAEGPRYSSITQCALNAYAVDADEMVVVYLAVENLSPRELAKIGVEEWRRFAAEWTWSRDEYRPLAEAEIERLRQIKLLVEAGTLPSRSIPDPELPAGSLIVQPSKGLWELKDEKGETTDAGSTWHCMYCPYQARCQEDMDEGL